MKKLKLFFVRNYQRFIRFLISFSAIGCILFSSFAVGALSSFKPSIGAPTYFYAVDGAGTVWERTPDNPEGFKFTLTENSSNILSKVSVYGKLIGCSSFIVDVPVSFSVPPDSYFKGSYKFLSHLRLSTSDIGTSANALNLSATLFSTDGSSFPLSVSMKGSSATIFVPVVSSYDFIRFSFDVDVPKNYVSYRLSSVELYFSNFDFVYGSSQEFANSNISAFLNVIGTFFSQAVSFLSSCLAIIVASPALTVLCLAMPICGFSVLLLRRFIHT